MPILLTKRYLSSLSKYKGDGARIMTSHIRVKLFGKNI